MPTALIARKDSLLVAVPANPRDAPRQIVAGAANRVTGAIDMTRELLREAVELLAVAATRCLGRIRVN